MFDAILFDFDGVLADSEPVHFACWTEILTPLGIPLSWEDYLANCIGVTDRAMLEVLAHRVSPPADMDVLWKEYPRKKAMFRERAKANPPVLPETIALLKELAGSPALPMAVVSSSGRAEVEPVLEKLGLLGHFATTVFGEDVQRRKPAPDPYLLAAARLNCHRPLVVEDSIPGMEAGLAAGFPVLRITEPGEVPALVRQALAHAESLSPETLVRP